MEAERPIIGIIGGVGPYAGLDLTRKIFDNTVAAGDQDHLDLILINMPRLIPDRTRFILGQESVNPAQGILQCMGRLVAAGADIIGLPCNTAHSELIFDIVEAEAAARHPKVKVMHLIRETVAAAKPRARVVGLLATLGTYASGVYQRAFAKIGVEVLVPDEEGKKRIARAIYDTDIGIKAKSHPVTAEATRLLADEAKSLRERGADLVLMGCTEIPLALDPGKFDFPLLDPANVFARALVREVCPGKLLPEKLLS